MTTQDSGAARAKPAAQAPSRIARVVFVILALVVWFWTQSLIGKREFPPGAIGDAVHTLTEPAHQYLLAHPRIADGLLIVSSGLIDSFGIFLLGSSIFGPSIRPFLGLIILFGLRQICQLLCALPPPETMIWRHPGVPSLLVTYGVSNDMFFSGHTAIAVLGATELARLGRRWLTVTGVIVAVFEMAAVLVLRAHYTMDVFAGAVTALLVAGLAAQLAPPCDRWLGRVLKR